MVDPKVPGVFDGDGTGLCTPVVPTELASAFFAPDQGLVVPAGPAKVLPADLAHVPDVAAQPLIVLGTPLPFAPAFVVFYWDPVDPPYLIGVVLAHFFAFARHSNEHGPVSLGHTTKRQVQIQFRFQIRAFGVLERRRHSCVVLCALDFFVFFFFFTSDGVFFRARAIFS